MPPNTAAAPTAGSATTSVPSGGGGSTGSPSAPGSSAPTQTPSQGGAPNGASNGTQAQAAQPMKREPVLIKHRATIGDQEHELDIDIAEHIATSKHRFKADGADHEMTLSELLERAPLAQGAFKRMNEGQTAKKEAEALVQQFHGERAKLVEALRDPKKALGVLERTLGRDRLLSAVEAMIADEIETQKLPPDQRAARDQATQRDRELEERERRLQERESKNEERARESAKREADAMMARWREEWPKHLESVNVKATPHTLRLMVNVKAAAKAAGFPISDVEAAREVAREVQQLIGGLDGKTLEQVAPGIVQEVQRSQIEQLNAQVPGRIAQLQQANQTPPAREQKPPPATLEEFRDQRREEADEAYQRRLAGKRR